LYADSSPAADQLTGATHSATIHQLITKLKAAHNGLPVAGLADNPHVRIEQRHRAVTEAPS
jgi:hypothetical protein